MTAPLGYGWRRERQQNLEGGLYLREEEIESFDLNDYRDSLNLPVGFLDSTIQEGYHDTL